MDLDYQFIQMDAMTNPAVRFVSVRGKVWDNTNEEMAVAPTYANTAIALSRDDNMNGIPVRFPANLPSGDYHMIFYDAASPAKTDAYARWYRIGWLDKARELTYIKDMGPMA